MTDMQDTTELLQRGQAAARVGRRDEARRYLRRVVELEPGNVEAWLDLAGVEDDPTSKHACFEAALEADPGNVKAQLGLEMLSQEPAQDGSEEDGGEEQARASDPARRQDSIVVGAGRS